jgi:hypothetical protein
LVDVLIENALGLEDGAGADLKGISGWATGAGIKWNPSAAVVSLGCEISIWIFGQAKG